MENAKHLAVTEFRNNSGRFNVSENSIDSIYTHKLGKFQSLMVSFLISKDHLIFECAGIHYIIEKDLEDVKFWSEEFCEYFLLNMHCTTDAFICPWCYLYSPVVKDNIYKRRASCTYGNRHGGCDSYCANNEKELSNSLYRRIIRMVGEISAIRGMYELLNTHKVIAKTYPNSTILNNY